MYIYTSKTIIFKSMEIPFQYGKIVEYDSFIDRIEDRKELKGFLSNGINTILVSPRRWGKSSLVKVAMKELAEEYKNIKVCFLDAFKIHSEEEFYDAFASAVIEGVSSTAEKRWGDFVKYIKLISPTISFNDSPTTSVSLNLKFDPIKSNAESILNLPEKMAEDKGVKVIVCIDEFQQLANISEWKKLVSTMRSVWQQQHRTTYCLYGSKMHMMTTIFNNTQSPFYKFGQLINLKCISKDYWIPYIVDNFKKTRKEISTELAEKICETVQCNSWYIQQYCLFVWMHTDGIVTKEDLDKELQLVLDTNEESFLRVIDELPASQIAMLKAIAAGEQHLNAKETVTRYRLGQPRTITLNKKKLIEKDIIEKNRGKLYILDPMFDLWLKREYGL